ncbi:hypothetical protein MRX96_029848 [Rhipicephalus microplus]
MDREAGVGGCVEDACILSTLATPASVLIALTLAAPSTPADRLCALSAHYHIKEPSRIVDDDIAVHDDRRCRTLSFRVTHR